MEPPSLSTELRKLLLWLTLACLSRKFVQKQIDWTGGTEFLSKTIEMGVVLPESGRGFKNFARNCAAGTPLQEILDPPLKLKLEAGSLVLLRVTVDIITASKAS